MSGGREAHEQIDRVFHRLFDGLPVRQVQFRLFQRLSSISREVQKRGEGMAPAPIVRLDGDGLSGVTFGLRQKFPHAVFAYTPRKTVPEPRFLRQGVNGLFGLFPTSCPLTIFLLCKEGTTFVHDRHSHRFFYFCLFCFSELRDKVIVGRNGLCIFLLLIQINPLVEQHLRLFQV